MYREGDADQTAPRPCAPNTGSTPINRKTAAQIAWRNCLMTPLADKTRGAAFWLLGPAKET